MGDRNVAAGHEQIVHIAGIQAAVRDGRGINAVMDRPRLEFFAREVFAVLRIGKMQVDAPSRGECGILVENPLVDVILLEYVVAQQAARLPLSGDVGHPFQRTVRV